MWKFLCQCGNEKLIHIYKVKTGHTNSCGCLQRELTAKRSTTHGDKQVNKIAKEYTAWQNMIERCTNPNNTAFHNYGMRGITVCDKWLHSYENFFSDMGRKPTLKHTLDRIDGNKGYCKENCRWATRIVQGGNTRRNRWIEYNGKRMILADWARELNLKYKTLASRLKRGKSLEQIVSDVVTTK